MLKKHVQILLLGVFVVLAPWGMAAQSQRTTFDKVDNAPGMEEFRKGDEDLEWVHSFDPTGKAIISAKLEIRAWDVNSEVGQNDVVSIEGSTIGELEGADGAWSTTTFDLDPAFARQALADGKIEVHLDIDEGWVVWINWAKLTVVWTEAIQLLTNFDGCEKETPVSNWGAFTDGKRGKALESCTLDRIAPNKRGQAMRISYDVSAKDDSFAGFWMKFRLSNFDPDKVEALQFWIRGDQRSGFTTRLKTEIKVSEKAFGWRYVDLDEITDEWQQVTIPLSQFAKIGAWSETDEFVITFENSKATSKSGAIYVDDIEFVNK